MKVSTCGCSGRLPVTRCPGCGNCGSGWPLPLNSPQCLAVPHFQCDVCACWRREETSVGRRAHFPPAVHWRESKTPAHLRVYRVKLWGRELERPRRLFVFRRTDQQHFVASRAMVKKDTICVILASPNVSSVNFTSQNQQ